MVEAKFNSAADFWLEDDNELCEVVAKFNSAAEFWLEDDNELSDAVAKFVVSESSLDGNVLSVGVAKSVDVSDKAGVGEDVL